MKKILTLVIALIMVLTMIPATAEGLKVGLSMDDLNTEFWLGNYNAMHERAEELGVEIVEVIAGGDASKQNEQISDLIAQGCKVIQAERADFRPDRTGLQGHHHCRCRQRFHHLRDRGVR